MERCWRGRQHRPPALPFNTSGMYRGYVREDGKITVAIYKE
jgi:hypothetical protein